MAKSNSTVKKVRGKLTTMINTRINGWKFPWDVIENNSGDVIGQVFFTSAPENGVVQMSFDFEGHEEKEAEIRDALDKMTENTLFQQGVYYVAITPYADDEVTQKLITSIGYEKCDDVSMKEYGTYFRSKKIKSKVAIFTLFGIVLGGAISFSYSAVQFSEMPAWAGVLAGGGIGIVLALLFDRQENNRLKAATEYAYRSKK